MEKLYLLLLLNAAVSWAEDDNTPLVLSVCIWCHYRIYSRISRKIYDKILT